MSSRRISKSHSENLSNQQSVRINGVGHKRNLMKQEEIDLTPENHCDKERIVKSAHSISICINTFDEVSSEDNMRQDLLNDVDQGSDINNLGNGINKITIDDEDLKQSTDASILPISDNCDSKDKKRTKHLVRCEAVRESSLSPPPPNSEANQVNSNKTQSINTNHLTVYSNNKNVTIIKNSLKGSNNNSQSNSATSSPSLSRDSSTDNNLEFSIPELQVFLAETLRKNQKDRMFLFRVENDLLQLMKDGSRELHKFTPTSSYNRLLIHRVAAYFGLEHNVDHTHSSVIVTKTKNTQIPDKKLKDLVKDEDSASDEPKKSILKRDSTSLEDSSSSSFDKDKSPDSHLNGSLSDSSRSRSLEEREENYERVRARIFNNGKGNNGDEPKSSNGDVSPSPKSNENEETKPCEEATDSKTPVSSPESESHNDCDKAKEALLPTKPAAAAAITAVTNNSNTNNNTSNSPSLTKNNSETKKSGTPQNRFDGGGNRNRFNNRNKGAYSDPNQNRFQHNRKGEPLMGNHRANEGDWSLKPNLNAKLASQNMPYNLLYPNCVDGHFVPRFPPTLTPHIQQAGNQFHLAHPYMQSPLLPNEQLFPQVNYVNPSMLPLISNQANVPNSMLNAINYNSNGVNSTFSSNNLSMPNNYPFMYGNMPPFGPNGVPYSPPPNMSAQGHNFNSLLGIPYQHYPPAMPVNSLLPNMPPNFKPMNDFDKGQMKNANFHKSPMPPLLNYLPPGQFPYSPEVLDRNMTSVQFNPSHPSDMMMNNRAAAMQAAQYPLNSYPNGGAGGNKRHPNEMLLNNPNLPPQAQSTMYLNQPKSFFANQPKQNSLNKYPNNNGNNRNRRGANHSNNSNRKF